MSEQVADRFETQAVRYLYRTVVMEEEHRPMPQDPSPAMLIERVRERVAMVDEMIVNYERECCVADLTLVAVHLMWLGAASVTAAVHMDPECVDCHPTDLKDRVLDLIDEQLAGGVENHAKEGEIHPRELVEPCSSLLCYAEQTLEDEDDPSAELLEHVAVQLLSIASSATFALAEVDEWRRRPDEQASASQRESTAS